MLLLSIVCVAKRYCIIIINNTRLWLKLFPLISLFLDSRKFLPLKYLILLRYDFFKPFLRSEYEKIVLSKEQAEAFINDSLPAYEIKPVAGDGMCILHSFVEGFQRIGNKVTLSEAESSLRGELTSIHAYYKEFIPDDICLLDELQLFLDSPMEYCNINTVDLFLYALSNAFQVDALVIKSNFEDC